MPLVFPPFAEIIISHVSILLDLCRRRIENFNMVTPALESIAQPLGNGDLHEIPWVTKIERFSRQWWEEAERC